MHSVFRSLSKISSLSLAVVLATAAFGTAMADGLGAKGASYGANKAWYASVFAGGSFTTDDVEFSNGTTTVDTDFETGFNVGGIIGYRWNNVKMGRFVPRTEVEVRYTENDVDSLDFSGNGAGNENVASGSDISSVSILANLYFDAPDAFTVFGNSITPYFGGGIGVNIVDHDIVYNGPQLNLRDTDEAFTWHVTVGYSFKVWDSVDWFSQVGFHQTIDVGSTRRIGPARVVGAGGGRFEDDINSVVTKSGLRINF